MDNCIEGLLDRDGARAFVRRHLHSPVVVLHSMVDFGVGMIDRYARRGENLTDAVILGLFLKSIVAQLDSVAVLLQHGAAQAAEVPARALLENRIKFAWLLHQETDYRARCFLIWYQRQNLLWARRSIPGTPENLSVTSAYEESFSNLDARAIFEKKVRAESAEASILEWLDKAENRGINAEFDRLRKRRRNDVEWYVPTGVASVGAMASSLGIRSTYDVFYSQFSDATHGSAFSEHVTFDQNQVVFEPIRNPAKYHQVFVVSAASTLSVFYLVIGHYAPEDALMLSREYDQEWRAVFLNPPAVNVVSTY